MTAEPNLTPKLQLTTLLTTDSYLAVTILPMLPYRRLFPQNFLTAQLAVQDIITVSPDRLPGYEEKIKSFFEEHLHVDEEIRFILDGSGAYLFRNAAVRAPQRLWFPCCVMRTFQTVQATSTCGPTMRTGFGSHARREI